MLFAVGAAGAQNRVFYAGNAGRDVFRDVHRLSDGSLLIAGQAENLDWIPSSVPRTVLPATGLQSSAQGQIGFILHTDGDFGAIRRVVHWPAGTARDVFKIRSTEIPGRPTGAIVISGSRDGAATDGYYLARLVGNGVEAPISGVAWVYNVPASGSHKDRQPWDVGGDGGVVYATGREFDPNWATIEKLDAQGRRAVVEHWNAHWHAGGEWNGTPASSYTNSAQPLQYSAIVMKVNRRGSLRSTTAFDFATTGVDGNGNGGRKGRFPDDYYHASHCELSGTNTCPNTGPGYTGYRAANAQTQRVGAIAVSREDNAIFFGYSTKSVLPDGNPDFEPAIVAMDADGRLRWWDRGYRETTQNSSPDQYIDGLAIDPLNRRLVVLGRTHGNNTVNFWRGNEIAVKGSSGAGFQNQFTGTNGNIHVSWLGSYRANEGVIEASTYVAEYVEGPTNFGAPLDDAFFGGWPDPNRGWPNVNTTRCGADAGYSGEIAVGPQGDVAVLCIGRRVLTTSDAQQRMPRPNVTPYETGAWSEFVRVYTPDLSTVRYSSLVTGDWNRSTGAGGDNTDLVGVDLAADGVRVVGRQRADAGNVPVGQPVPSTGVPAWGAGQPAGESALAARLTGLRIGGTAVSGVGGPEWIAAPAPIVAASDRGHVDVSLAGLPATSDLRIEAFGPVAPLNTVTSFATADPTPDDPFDPGSGAAPFRRLLLPPAQVQRTRVLFEVAPTLGSVVVYMGVDLDGDESPDPEETRCRVASAMLARCDATVVQEPGARATWWAFVQTRDPRAEFGVAFYEVPVVSPNTDARLAATSAAAVSAGAAQPVRVVWNDPTLLAGQRRAGWLRLLSGDGVLGWVPVRIDRSGSRPPTAHALPLGEDYTLALPANGVHERLYVDVPTGASELRVEARSADLRFTVHLARRPLLVPDAAVPDVSIAPERGAATAQTPVQPGAPAVVTVPNPVAGRWYVTPTNTTAATAGLVTLRASLSANAPRPPFGGYFNSARSGHGLFLYPASGVWAGLWFTYLQDGSPTWYYLQAPAPGANGHWRAPIYRSTWHGRGNRLVAVGEATLVPNLAPSPGGFVFSYTLDGESGSEAFIDFGGSCPSIDGNRVDVAGHWFDPARAGSGYSVQLFPNAEFYAAFIYDARGVARFLDAQRGGLGATVSALDLTQLRGFCPLCVRSGNPTRTIVGRLQRTVGAGRLTRITTDGAFVDGVPGRWTSDDAVTPLGSTKGCP